MVQEGEVGLMAPSEHPDDERRDDQADPEPGHDWQESLPQVPADAVVGELTRR